MVDRGCERRADVDETDGGDEAAEQPRPRTGVDAGSRHRMSQTDLRTSVGTSPDAATVLRFSYRLRSGGVAVLRKHSAGGVDQRGAPADHPVPSG
jgi:hypothetical protein